MNESKVSLNQYEITLIRVLGREYPNTHIELSEIYDIADQYGFTKHVSPYIIWSVQEKPIFKKIINTKEKVKSIDVNFGEEELKNIFKYGVPSEDIKLFERLKKNIPYLSVDSLKSIQNIYLISKRFDIRDIFEDYIIEYYLPTLHNRGELKLFGNWDGIMSYKLYKAIKDKYYKDSHEWESNSAENKYVFSNSKNAVVTNKFIKYVINQTKNGKKATRKDFLIKIGRPTYSGYLGSFFAAINQAGIVKLNRDNTYEIGPKYELYKSGKLQKKRSWKYPDERKIVKSVLREHILDNDLAEIGNFFMEKYHVRNSEKLWNEIKGDIEKSPASKIILVDNHNFCGMSLNSGVYISKIMFDLPIYVFIYSLFHEIAHQYQYSKYGKNLFYSLATQDIDEKLIDVVISIEKIADEFGKKMSRKYLRLFNLPFSVIRSPYDSQYGRDGYKLFIKDIQSKIKEGKVHCVEEMENYLSTASLDSLKK